MLLTLPLLKALALLSSTQVPGCLSHPQAKQLSAGLMVTSPPATQPTVPCPTDWTSIHQSCQFLDSSSVHPNFTDPSPEPEGLLSGVVPAWLSGQSPAPMRKMKSEGKWLPSFLWPQRPHPSSHLLPPFDIPTRTLDVAL